MTLAFPYERVIPLSLIYSILWNHPSNTTTRILHITRISWNQMNMHMKSKRQIGPTYKFRWGLGYYLGNFLKEIQDTGKDADHGSSRSKASISVKSILGSCSNR